MVQQIRNLVESEGFNRTIMVAIFVSAVIVGLETSAKIMEQYGTLIGLLQFAILGLFVAEIALRIAAYGLRIHHFFSDGWNVFDFVVVAVSLMPGSGSVAVVARLARVMRELPIITYSRDLQMTANAMLRSIPSLGIVGVLILGLMYIYAVCGVFLFGPSDPARWGDLGVAMLSCFKLLTLEGWVDMQNTVIDRHPYAFLFFGSFVLLGVFVMVNVFVAMVVRNLENAQREAQSPEERILAEIRSLRDRIERYEMRMKSG